MSKGLPFLRYSPESLGGAGPRQDSQGRIFMGKRISVDLSHVLICGHYVDTIRQLYRGVLRSDVLESIKAACEGSGVIDLGSIGVCSVSRMGKASGYRFKLQTNQEGVIALVSSYYSQEDKEGSHLKIELSPHFIAQFGVKQVQARLAIIACQLLQTSEPAGCAVHLAVDVQGWAPSADFQERFTTRARGVRRYDGVSDIQYDFSEVSCIYGNKSAQSMLYGKASSLQAAIYCKSDEMLVSDKVDYYQEKWSKYTFGQYDPSQPVWRVEMRLHHNVLADIANSQGETWKTFEHVSRHLTDIWRYCLTNNRLDYSSVYIDPFWQLIRDSIAFYHPADFLSIRRKKKQDQSAIGRNYGLILGNLITVFSRQMFSAEMILRDIKRLSLYRDMLTYYRLERKMTEDDLLDFIRAGVVKRQTLGKSA
jgi:hypothetical protein